MEGSAGGAPDKKRNKLGYHRTSVACATSRRTAPDTTFLDGLIRRKIRCLLASDDTQGRCENCIRLKKECHFYPVDQQPPMEKRSRAGSRAEPPTPEAPLITPPTLLGGTIVEQKDSYFPYPSMPVNTAPDMAVFSHGAYGAATMPPYSPDLTASHGLGPVPPLVQPATWNTPSLYGQQLSSVPATIQASPPADSMWDQNSPISSLAVMDAAVNSAGLVPSNVSGNHAFGVVPDRSAWNLQPSGTMPISSPEAAAPGYPSQLHTALPTEYKASMRNPARLYSASMNAPISGLQPSNIPVSYGAQQQAMAYSTWNMTGPPDVSNTGQPIATAIPNPMAGWYGGDPAQYAQMKQETPAVSNPLHHFDPGAPYHSQNQ
ncbi:hypothetical protein PRK78_006879 [Emydomyces testavorans]|uniref:Zn(2)-C6 fungal-type domain-containing protein n=1 Tax=Emydomyces testavorans TaxID=2070801 RepID=A0AAF0DM97_9EURO|nr:hypothetical protein PRK78_006879 [Emydomyces testavorans]